MVSPSEATDRSQQGGRRLHKQAMGIMITRATTHASTLPNPRGHYGRLRSASILATRRPRASRAMQVSTLGRHLTVVQQPEALVDIDNPVHPSSSSSSSSNNQQGIRVTSLIHQSARNHKMVGGGNDSYHTRGVTETSYLASYRWCSVYFYVFTPAFQMLR